MSNRLGLNFFDNPSNIVRIQKVTRKVRNPWRRLAWGSHVETKNRVPASSKHLGQMETNEPGISCDENLQQSLPVGPSTTAL